jgi:hypothetical protein
MEMVRVMEFGFTRRKILFTKTVNDTTYEAEYYPEGFNAVRAVFNKSRGGIFRYALALKYCNPEVSKESLAMQILKECYEKGADLTINYITYCVDQAFDIKNPDIIQTKKVRFKDYAFFLKQKEKAAWVREIKSELIMSDVTEFYNELGADVSAKDCAEALGISRQSASKYKKIWKKSQL